MPKRSRSAGCQQAAAKRLAASRLTHMLNRRGRIELEPPWCGLAEDRFYLVCAAFFEQRLIDHLAQHLGGETRMRRSSNLSTDWGAMALNGPRARDILAPAPRCRAGQCILPLADGTGDREWPAKVWAFRMSYAGELGWELHVPREACWRLRRALGGRGSAWVSPITAPSP
jgi:dimethylglycine dehydrogenase